MILILTIMGTSSKSKAKSLLQGFGCLVGRHTHNLKSVASPFEGSIGDFLCFLSVSGSDDLSGALGHPTANGVDSSHYSIV